VKLFLRGGLTPDELYKFIKEEEREDIKEYLSVDDSFIDFVKSLNYSSFMSYYSKFLSKLHKYYKYSSQ